MYSVMMNVILSLMRVKNLEDIRGLQTAAVSKMNGNTTTD